MQIPKTADASSPLAIGFSTVVEVAEGEGWMGGYLLLNAAARPLEFHCTAPVRSNRAQEILYGPTLRPFLFGEQIAVALIAKSQARPAWIATDVLEVLAARPLQDAPLGCLNDSGELPLGAHSVSLARGYETDAEPIRQCWRQSESLDLQEPFERIVEAVREAQKSCKTAA